MREAIKEARKSLEPLKCGVVIVRDGKIIARAHNTQRETNNASAHAEINAVAVAGNELKNKHLEGCEVYCTCEPCIMCLTALSYAKIKILYYGLTLKKVSDKDKVIDIGVEEFMEKSPYKFVVIKNFLEEECEVLL